MAENYVPALRFTWATGLYDLVISLFMREKLLRRRSAALISENPRVILEAGCGTGSLTTALAETFGAAEIVAVDIDPAILDVARKKASRFENITFQQASLISSDDMKGASPGHADAVISSLVFHHLTDDGKKAALRNLKAVMAPGAELHIVDWGPPKGVLAFIGFWLVRLLDGMAVTSANYHGKLPEMIGEAGFTEVEAHPLHQTTLGTVWHYVAKIAG